MAKFLRLAAEACSMLAERPPSKDDADKVGEEMNILLVTGVLGQLEDLIPQLIEKLRDLS